MHRPKSSRLKIVSRALRVVWPAITTFAVALSAAGQEMNSHHHGDSSVADSEISQDWAKQRVARSPRHREWVKIKNGKREVNSFTVYPEVNRKRRRSWSFTKSSG